MSPHRIWTLAPLLGLLSIGVACSGNCGADLSAGTSSGVVDGADWTSGEVTWNWSGSSLQITSTSSEGWLLTLVAQTDLDGVDLETAAAGGKFPIEVDLQEGGWGILYDADRSYTSNGASGGTLEIDEIGDVVRACFDFEAAASDGTLVTASGSVHAEEK